MSTVRSVLVLGALTVVALLLAGLAVHDPFHWRYAPWFVGGLVLLAIVLLTATLAVAVTVWIGRVLVLVLGLVAAAGWASAAWILIGLGDDGRFVSEVASGGQRLVVLEGGAFAIDPVFRVVLRVGSGPFEQQSVVWQGREDGPGPGEVAFRGADEVEIRTGSCVQVSRVEPVTLSVDPVHQALDSC